MADQTTTNAVPNLSEAELISTGRHGTNTEGFDYDDVKTGLCNGPITELIISSGAMIDTISIKYGDHQTPVYGAWKGDRTYYTDSVPPPKTIRLLDNEYIVSVSGSAGKHVDRLVFVTNRRRTFEFGSSYCGGPEFTAAPAKPGMMLVGIKGNAGQYMNQVEFIWTLIPAHADAAVDPSTCYDTLSLPKEIALIIAAVNEPKDLAMLGETCKFWRGIAFHPWVWFNKIVKEFGRHRIPEGVPIPADINAAEKSGYNFRALYARLTRSRYFVAKSFGVTHLGSEYFIRVDDESSECGQAIKLNRVWWLDVRKTVTVLPGTYKLKWRLKVDDSVYLGGPITLNIKMQPKDGSADKSTVAKFELTDDLARSLLAQHGQEFFVLDVGDVTVDKPSTTIVEWVAHDGDMKAGVFWDYFEFQPVETVSSARALPAAAAGGCCGSHSASTRAALERGRLVGAGIAVAVTVLGLLVRKLRG